jgi:hypothetical protein
MRLENTKVKKWKDLVDAFMRQYKFNIDVDPDRLNLQAMEKDNKESISDTTHLSHTLHPLHYGDYSP